MHNILANFSLNPALLRQIHTLIKKTAALAAVFKIKYGRAPRFDQALPNVLYQPAPTRQPYGTQNLLLTAASSRT